MIPNPRPKPPRPGGEYTHISDSGPQPVSPGIPRVDLIPVGDGGPHLLLPQMLRPRKRRPLLPDAAALAKLPRAARAAFEARCAARAGLASATVAEAAVAILHAASDPADLLFIRRDFSRLRVLAKQGGWTDDTLVPPDALGPLWPPGRVPEWATHANGTGG